MAPIQIQLVLVTTFFLGTRQDKSGQPKLNYQKTMARVHIGITLITTHQSIRWFMEECQAPHRLVTLLAR